METNLWISVGNTRGSWKNKDNRAARLLQKWDIIRKKMEAYIIKGNGITLRARCAYAVLLMMETGIRVGNESSAEGYVCGQKHHKSYGKKVKTYGLITLRSEHMRVSHNSIYVSFLGKKAVDQYLVARDYTLMQYFNIINDASFDPWLGITYGDLYNFIKKSVGRQFKLKDIRTAAVNIKFINELEDSDLLSISYNTKSEANRLLRQTVEHTAEDIGHTPGVCRSSYLSMNMLATVKSIMYSTVAERKKQARLARN